MIQFSTQPLAGVPTGVRAAGFPLGSASDFALALADLAGSPTPDTAPAPLPNGFVEATLPAAAALQAAAADGKALPAETMTMFEVAASTPLADARRPTVDAALEPALPLDLALPALRLTVGGSPAPQVFTPVVTASVQPIAAPVTDQSLHLFSEPLRQTVPNSAPTQPGAVEAPQPDSPIGDAAAMTPATLTATAVTERTPTIAPASKNNVPRRPDTPAQLRDAGVVRPPVTATTDTSLAIDAPLPGTPDEASPDDDDAAIAATLLPRGAIVAPPEALVTAATQTAAAAPNDEPVVVPASTRSVVPLAGLAVSETAPPTAAPRSPAPVPQSTGAVPPVLAARTAASSPEAVASRATGGGERSAETPKPAETAESTPLTSHAKPQTDCANASDAAVRPIVTAAPASPDTVHTMPVATPPLPVQAPAAPTAVTAIADDLTLVLRSPSMPSLTAAQTSVARADGPRSDVRSSTAVGVQPLPSDAVVPAPGIVRRADELASAPLPTAPIEALGATTGYRRTSSSALPPAPVEAMSATVVPAHTSAPATAVASTPMVASSPIPASFTRPIAPIIADAATPILRVAAEPAAPTLIAPRGSDAAAAPVIVSVAALPAAAPVPAPQAQPAAQAFAAAMFAAAAPAEAARDDESDDLTMALAPVGTPTLQHAPMIAVAAAAPGDQPTLDLTRDDWMASMIDRIETLRDEGGGVRETRMKLAPEALGNIEVSVRRDEAGAIQVRIAADTPQARAMLAEAAPKLAEMAEARGVKLGGSSVDAGGTSGDGGRREAQPSAPVPVRPASIAVADDTTDTFTNSRLA